MAPSSRPPRKSSARKKSAFIPLGDAFASRRISKLGVASFVLSLSPFIMALGTMVWLIIDIGLTNDPAQITSGEEVGAKAGFFIVASALCLASIVLGFVLGLISVFQKKRDRDFGLIGLGISAFWILMGLMDVLFPSV